jgi:hypothetical protein
MYSLLVVGAVLIIFVGMPALVWIIRLILRRPLSPDQAALEERLRERRRDTTYFWR